MFINGTVTSDVFFCLLSNERVPFLMGYGIPMNSAWFQQDGTQLHTRKAILHFLLDILRRESCKTSIMHHFRKVLAACFMLCLISNHEDGGDMFV
jgi:hypothetical protein